MIKAHIRKDGDALWLVIDREDGSTAHPILEDEIEAILNACKKWSTSTYHDCTCKDCGKVYAVDHHFGGEREIKENDCALCKGNKSVCYNCFYKDHD